MTTRFLDFESGDDANDGSTFALRKLTLASAQSGLAAGAHEIRIKGSPPPTLLGSATWTDDSGTVTLAAAVTANIDDGEVAWTASANVTATASTATYREGTKSANLVIAAGFTTGKVAYKATGTLDLSGYQQVSFWIRTSLSLAAAPLELKLCTDTVGDVAVHTIAIPAVTTTNNWQVFTIDLGVNLDAAIESVALYAVSDPGSVTVNLDNIIACKAASADDSLTLNSLISRNADADDPWFAVNTINGTTVKLRTSNYATAAQGSSEQKWVGTTASYSTYKREAVVLSAVQTVTVDGTDSDNPFTVSGGWDRTDMSTQDDVTWLRPRAAGYALISTNTATYNLKFQKLYFAGTYTNSQVGLQIFQTCIGTEIDDCVGAGCVSPFYLGAQGVQAFIPYVTSFTYGIYFPEPESTPHPEPYVRAGKLWGEIGSSYGVYYNPSYQSDITLDIDEIRNCSNGIRLGNEGSGRVNVKNTVFAGNVVDYNSGFRTVTHFDNCSFSGATVPGSTRKTFFRKYNKTADDHRIYGGDNSGSSIVTATDQQYDVASLSWKFNPKKVPSSSEALWSSRFPLSMVLAKVACNAGEVRTVTVYMRRDNTGLNMRLRVKGRQIDGIPSDVSAMAVGAANSWEAVMISFTPTEAGVVEVLAEAWGGTTYSGWVNHLEVT